MYYSSQEQAGLGFVPWGQQSPSNSERLCRAPDTSLTAALYPFKSLLETEKKHERNWSVESSYRVNLHCSSGFMDSSWALVTSQGDGGGKSEALAASPPHPTAHGWDQPLEKAELERHEWLQPAPWGPQHPWEGRKVKALPLGFGRHSAMLLCTDGHRSCAVHVLVAGLSQLCWGLIQMPSWMEPSHINRLCHPFWNRLFFNFPFQNVPCSWLPPSSIILTATLWGKQTNKQQSSILWQPSERPYLALYLERMMQPQPAPAELPPRGNAPCCLVKQCGTLCKTQVVLDLPNNHD